MERLSREVWDTDLWCGDTAMIRQIFAVVKFNFLGFFHNPKVILTFLLGIVLSFLLSEKVMRIVTYFQTPMQAAEPFIWTFGDTTAVLCSALLLLLIFSDLPKLSDASMFYLIRTTKKRWLTAQLIYIISVTGIYMGFMMIVTCVLCAKDSFIGNMWSKTAALLGYSEMGREMQIPSTVRVMESIQPYGCAIQVIMLLFGYALTMGFLVLLCNMAFGKKAGILAGLCYSLYGFLMDPEILGKMMGLEPFEMYKVRTATGWISPLNHAVYGRHNFGYDHLPTVGQSCMVFFLILCILAFLSFRVLKRYPLSKSRVI